MRNYKWAIVVMAIFVWGISSVVLVVYWGPSGESPNTDAVVTVDTGLEDTCESDKASLQTNYEKRLRNCRRRLEEVKEDRDRWYKLHIECVVEELK